MASLEAARQTQSWYCLWNMVQIDIAFKRGLHAISQLLLNPPQLSLDFHLPGILGFSFTVFLLSCQMRLLQEWVLSPCSPTPKWEINHSLKALKLTSILWFCLSYHNRRLQRWSEEKQFRLQMLPQYLEWHSPTHILSQHGRILIADFDQFVTRII